MEPFPAVRPGIVDWRMAVRALGAAFANLPACEQTAHILASRGHQREAAELYAELLRDRPDQPLLLRAYAQLLRQLGRWEAAADMQRRAVAAEAGRFELDASARAEAAEFLVAMAAGETDLARIPSGYLAACFDHYEDYDERMLGRLSYRAPQILMTAINEALGPSPAPLRVLDLGCGTGLMGAVVRPIAARLDGMDLSSAMIERSRLRGVYDRLDVGDVLDLLAVRNDAYDLLVAADLCPYIGDLTPLLSACAKVVAADGLMAFTVERGQDGWSLGGTRRFVHAPEHVRQAAAVAGWRVASLAESVLRTEGGTPVVGLAVVLTTVGSVSGTPTRV